MGFLLIGCILVVYIVLESFLRASPPLPILSAFHAAVGALITCVFRFFTHLYAFSACHAGGSREKRHHYGGFPLSANAMRA